MKPGQMSIKQGMKQIPSLGRTIKYMLKQYKFACLVVLMSIIASAIATLVATMFMKSLIDDYITPLLGITNPDFGPLAQALLEMCGVLIIGVLCSYASTRIMVTVAEGTMKRLRDDIFEHMETLPIRYFDTHAHGDIMSVYTNDIDTLRQLISQALPQLLNSLITIVSTLISMIILDIPLTIVSLAMAGIMFVVTTKITGESSTHFSNQQRDLGKVNGYIEEMMEGQKVVKVFCHEEKSIAEFREINDQLRHSAYNANKLTNIIMPINNNIGNISYVLVAVIGGMLALSGMTTLTLGTLVAFLTLNKNFTQPVTQISQQLASVVMAAAGAERVFKLLDEEPESDDGYVTVVNAIIDDNDNITESEKTTGTWAWKNGHATGNDDKYRVMQGAVTFKNVDFGYTTEKTVLHDISLFAKPGQKIAFVGKTGAGKTTITNLINRFYDIQSGKITYDGIDIAKLKKTDLRRSLGIVLQDTHLFTGTVMENIRYGRLDATDEECIAAAKLANADEFIQHLSDGYATELKGDGGNLSQGQRQLLAIARAAVADPPAMILDEATSSIDTHTEALVQEGMDALMKGRTSFVIAHRLSTVRNADCIMVMDAGRIIERGTHDELIAQKGRYYTLYTGNKLEDE